ncbi:RING finger protein 214 [Gouania willdenowi]|uniref:RING finger protein 214-like n=1 Tax=Gouania willdenowi TaxID=441366 RepID=A0A8C5G981_GOUWI|nr:RING finger protein 214-like [Gouania willdenowi]
MDANNELSDPYLDLDFYRDPESDPDLDLHLSKMTIEDSDVAQNDQAVQVECSTNTCGVNTDPEWESQVAAMFEYCSSLKEEYESLAQKQNKEEEENAKDKLQLQMRKDEATRQHQALLDKLDSLRVKLQLNNSKASRKNFLTKKQEMMSEKTRAEEERNSLVKELEESEQKLTALTVEQREEQSKWREELEELRKEMERVRKETQKAQRESVQNEITAMEKQRDAAMFRMEAWLSEVGQYLNVLRMEFPQQYSKERLKWEKMESTVRRNKTELLARFQDAVQQLQQGREMETLPKMSVPPLPPIPMADVRFSQVMQSVLRPPQIRTPVPINPGVQSFPPTRSAVFNVSRPPFPQHYQPPPPPLQHPPSFQHMIGAPLRMTAPPSSSPSPPAPPLQPGAPPPPAAGKLDKYLERLGKSFPQCSRSDLTRLLQQVKGSRGTLAGLSMDELIEQVGFKLVQNDPPPPPPQLAMGRPAALGPIQRPVTSQFRARAPGPPGPPRGPTVAPRKLCLMCQNHVDPENRHPLSCSHTIHRDCIQVWLQSSKNNSCPFCPGK